MTNDFKMKITLENLTPAQAILVAQFAAELAARDADFAAVAPMVTAPNVPPPPPSSSPQAPSVTAPAAAPTTGQSAATVSNPDDKTVWDKRGVPWHADHHAGTKGMNNDGSWKRKKNANADAVAAYEAQFVGKSPVPAAPAAPPPPMNGTAPQQTAASGGQYPTAEQINAQHAPHLPPQGATLAPPPPPAPPAPPAPPVMFTPTYSQFYDKYIYLNGAGVFTNEIVDQINKVAGVADLNGYSGNDHAMTMAWGEFVKLEQQLNA